MAHNAGGPLPASFSCVNVVRAPPPFTSLTCRVSQKPSQHSWQCQIMPRCCSRPLFASYLLPDCLPTGFHYLLPDIFLVASR